MEINKQESIIPVLSKVYETAAEQGVDTEFTLPDYYPEISKILKILTVVNISSTKCDNGSVNLGGQTVLTMLYLGNDDNLNSFTHHVPFVKNIEVPFESKGIVSVATQVNYVNFKAVSPRKVELHGAFSLNVSIENIVNNNCLLSCNLEGIYTKNKNSVIVVPMSPISKSVFVNDEIAVGEGKSSIGKILRNHAQVQISECKYLSGKTVIKGEVILELLCIPSDNGRPFSIKEPQSFSQVFDCDAQGEEIAFDVRSHIENIELRPKTSLDGEVRTVAFEVKFCLDIVGYYAKEINYVSDAFSCKYLADIKKKSIGVEEYVVNVNDKILCEKEFDFAGVIKEVLDLNCDAKIEYCTLDEQAVIVKGIIPISIIGTDSQGDYGYFEKSMDFEYRYNLAQNPNRIRCNPTINVVAIKHNLMSDGTLVLAIELKIVCNVFGINDADVVVSLDIDSDNVVNAVENTAITLYFAENESPWEIAQKYGVSPKGICEANNLEDIDIKHKGVLLIPCI